MKCNLSTVNDWCGIFNKPCKECISPTCKFIKKAYRQGRVEAEYFTCYKNDWIPVDKKLPENNEWYIVSLEDATTSHALFSNGKWYYEAFDFGLGEYREHEIIAWQPLPKPYKSI